MVNKLGLAVLLHLGSLASILAQDQQSKTTTSPPQEDISNDAQKVVDWLKARDGAFVNPKLEFRRTDPSDPTSMSGIFAKELIEEDEVLIHVPWHSLFSSERNGTEWQSETYQSCGTIHNLIDEFKKGDDSEFAHYTNYLKTQPVNQLPSSWSAAGKLLLIDILDGQSHRQSLPPFGPLHHHDEWLNDCEGSIEDIGVAMLVISRADEDILTPVYDLSNHPTSGAQINMAMNQEKGVHHQTRAARVIQPGEQLYNSYNLCDTCGSRHDNFGTPEMLTDYGFVEGMPQRWYFFYGETLRLELDDEDNNGVVVATWNEDLAPQQANAIGQFFRHELRRLARLKTRIQKLGTIQHTVPPNEWNTTWQYYDAIVNAMKYGFESLGGERDEICTQTSIGGVNPCGHYADPVRMEDDLPYSLSSTCRNNYPKDYSLVETVTVLHDSTTVDVRRKTYNEGQEEETCLFNNNELVVCKGSEADVYEPLVHFPARFVESVEWVLIVGGGNTMALNEVLKYPSLERVVVMEEDEKLARKSVEYFQTSAYFDEDTVEWLFGPIDLSVLFGGDDNDDDSRFDLIIVENDDLNDEATVRALACLLDPEGLVAGYGTDMTALSRVFKYSTQALFEDPFICKYTNMVLASHDVGFLTGVSWEHPISLTTELIEEGYDHVDMLQNYYYNNNAHSWTQAKCQASAQGYAIMEIMEMEGVFKQDNIQKILRDSLSSHGYDLLSKPSQSSNESFAIVLSEGYLFVRVFSTMGYVGLDIHMWNSTYDDIKYLRNTVVDTLEASSTSSFRMFQSSMSQPNDNGGVDHATAHVMTNSMVKKAWTYEEMHQFQMLVTSFVLQVPLLKLKDIQVGVVCGRENALECPSYNIARNISMAGSVTPFWTCPEMDVGNVQDPEDLDLIMVSCERDLAKQMDKATEAHRLHVLIIDNSAGPLMLQILDSMLSSAANQMEWFSSGHLLLALSFDDQDGGGVLLSRRAFLDRVRQYMWIVPATLVEYVLPSDVQAVELGFVVSGNADAIDIIVEYHDLLEESMQAANLKGLSGVDLRRIIGATTMPQEVDDASWDLDEPYYEEDLMNSGDIYYYNDEEEDEGESEVINEDEYDEDEDDNEAVPEQDLNYDCNELSEGACGDDDDGGDYNEARQKGVLERLDGYRTVVHLQMMTTMTGQWISPAGVSFDSLARGIENVCTDMGLQMSAETWVTSSKQGGNISIAIVSLLEGYLALTYDGAMGTIAIHIDLDTPYQNDDLIERYLARLQTTYPAITTKVTESKHPRRISAQIMSL